MLFNAVLLDIIKRDDLREFEQIFPTLDLTFHVSDPQKTVVHWVAQCGALQIMAFLLRTDPNLLSVCDQYCHTPLCDAVIAGQRAMVEYLVGQGANFRQVTQHPSSPNAEPIHLAALSKPPRMDLVHYFLGLGVQYQSIGQSQYGLIHVAISNNDFPLLERALQEDPSQVNQTDEYGQIPLMAAVVYQRQSMVERLLTYRPKLNIVINLPGNNNHGAGLLDFAIQQNGGVILRMLLDVGL